MPTGSRMLPFHQVNLRELDLQVTHRLYSLWTAKNRVFFMPVIRQYSIYNVWCAQSVVSDFFAAPRTVALLLAMASSRQEYWSGLPCPPSRRSSQLRDQTHLLHLLHWKAGCLPLNHLGSPQCIMGKHKMIEWDMETTQCWNADFRFLLFPHWF